MSAKEMFEELGYKYVKLDDLFCYINKKDNVRIAFVNCEYGKSIIIEDDCHMATYINKNELQAINKQVEELGWNK